jgi:lauroyl/myristoyl acyltransferase
MARPLGRLSTALMPVERAAIRRTMARVTGATGARLEALTLGTFADFAMCFSDLVSTNRQPAHRLSCRVGRLDGVEHVNSLARGFVSLTAHVGNWELAGRLLAGRTARTTHVVVAEDEAAALEQWVRRHGDGVRFVPRSRPTIALELVAALRRGEVVAVQGDRALGTRGDALLPFFGHPAPFPLGPFYLARAVGVPLVPAFCLLGADYQYEITVGRPISVARGQEEDGARQWVAALERIVSQRPTQWFNFFDIWSPVIP